MLHRHGRFVRDDACAENLRGRDGSHAENYSKNRTNISGGARLHKNGFLLYRAKLMRRAELKSLSYNVKAAPFVTLQRFSFLIPLRFESPIAILVMSSEIDASQLNGQS